MLLQNIAQNAFALGTLFYGVIHLINLIESALLGHLPEILQSLFAAVNLIAFFAAFQGIITGLVQVETHFLHGILKN